MILLGIVTLIGTSGYMILEGWPFVDSLFMTVITLATVGYSTLYPLSDPGKWFTILLIVAGVGTAAYVFTAIGQIIIEGELQAIRGFRDMERKIAALRGHTIVCGFGRLARIVVNRLRQTNHSVVVIEANPDVIQEVIALGIPCVEGSADHDETLLEAGVERAKTLLALLPRDSDNVYVSLSARDLNSQIRIIARSEDEHAEVKLRRAGADQVVAPYGVSGTRLAEQLIRPHVSDFLQVFESKDGQRLALEEIVVPVTSKLVGQSLEESQLRSKTGAMIAAVIAPSGAMSLNPGGQAKIEPGSTLIVLGEPGSLSKVAEILEQG